jgi:hypothetical protein
MSPTMRAVDLSLRKSPGLPSFDTNHPVSRRNFLQGRPAWWPRWNQPSVGGCAMVLTCMPANEVAFGFRCTRRTSLLELTITRLAEGLRADGSLALDGVVTMVRDEIERGRKFASEHGARHQRAPNIQPRIHVITFEYTPTTSATGPYFFTRDDGHAMYGIKKLTAVEFFIIVIQVIPVHHLIRVERVGPHAATEPAGARSLGSKSTSPGLVAAPIHLKQILGVLHQDPIAHRPVHR